MSEPETPGNVRRADEIQAQQLVERVDRWSLGGAGGRCGQLGVEGVSRDGGALEDEACLLGEQSELLSERGGDCSGYVNACERRLVGRCRHVGTAGRPCELLEVEGIAAAVFVEAGCVHSVADQLAGVLGAQRPQFNAHDRAGAVRPFNRRAEPLAHLSRPHRHRDEYSSRGRSMEERTEQLDRRRICPVDVVEHEYQRLGLRECLEQCANGAVAAVALVLDRRPAPDREACQ